MLGLSAVGLLVATVRPRPRDQPVSPFTTSSFHPVPGGWLAGRAGCLPVRKKRHRAPTTTREKAEGSCPSPRGEQTYPSHVLCLTLERWVGLLASVGKGGQGGRTAAWGSSHGERAEAHKSRMTLCWGSKQSSRSIGRFGAE